MAPDNSDAPAPFVRRKCAECNHAESFHPDHQQCCAYGCQCEKWRDEEAKPKRKSRAKAKGAAR